MAPASNIADQIAQHARRDPNAAAVVRDGHAVSYAALERLAARAAARLSGQGIAAGTGVAVCVADPVLHMVVAVALARLGAAQFGVAAGPVSDTTLWVVAEARIGTLVTDVPGLAVGSLRAIPADESWLVERGAAAESAPRADDPDLPCLIATSSGTTGRPKLIAVTHRQLIARRRFCGAVIFVPGDRYLSLMDPAIFLSKSICLRMLQSGGSLHFCAARSLEDLFAYCDGQRISHSFALPFMLQTLLPKVPGPPRLPHLRCLWMAGSTVTPDMFAAAAATLTPDLFVAYGSNEMGTVSVADAQLRLRHPDAIGRSVPGVEWRIVDEAGAIVPPGTVGEIEVRAPGMIGDYPGQPELTAHHFRGGWFHPGDLVSATADGVLIFHGRADDMMIFDGLNIFPLEIERALLEHPAVAEAAAFPLRSAVHQEVPIAAVLLRAATSEQDLLAFARARLGLRAPRRVFAVGAFPRNATGKVVKADLVAEIEKRGGRGRDALDACALPPHPAAPAAPPPSPRRGEGRNQCDRTPSPQRGDGRGEGESKAQSCRSASMGSSLAARWAG